MGHWLGLLMDSRTANNLTMAALRVMAALLALLFEQQGDNLQAIDGLTVSLSHEPHSEGMDVIYTSNGQPVGGEGI